MVRDEIQIKDEKNVEYNIPCMGCNRSYTGFITTNIERKIYNVKFILRPLSEHVKI